MKRARFIPSVLNVFAALTLLSVPASLGAETKDPPPGVLAVVNGTPVTSEEIDALLVEDLARLRGLIDRAWAEELDLQINTRLLNDEARARGVTTTDLLRDEVLSRVQEPTDAEIATHFERNRERFPEGLEQASDAVRAELFFLRRQEVAASLAERLRAHAELARLVESPSPPRTAADRARVLAVVNDTEITLADVEEGLKALVFRVEEQIYLHRRAQVDLRVNDLLLEAEAERRQTSPASLLEAELRARRRPITESDARTFFEENKDRLGLDWNDEDQRLELLRYLHERETLRAQAAFAAKLRERASITTSLEPPPSPIYDIPTDDEPSRGAPLAPVTIVEFIDYACTTCAQAEATLDRLLAEYEGRVRLVSRDFPLQREHPNAYRAAVAAEAARAEGKYWEYRRLLFRDSTSLVVESLRAHARAVGLDPARFDAALEQTRFRTAVDEDLEAGLRFGVHETPTFFVNGRPVQESSYESLKSAIDEALAGTESSAPSDAESRFVPRQSGPEGTSSGNDSFPEMEGDVHHEYK